MAIYENTSEYTDKNPSRPLYRLAQGVWFVLSIIEILLAFKFILRLLGANPLAGFTNFIYSTTAPFIWPFITVFPNPRIDRAVVE